MQFLLSVHIVAGGLAIVTGGIALLATKGAMVHRKSGLAFVASMLAMGISGTILALLTATYSNVIGGLMVVYLVTTALTTVHPSFAATRRPLEIGALTLALALGATNLVLAIVALGSARGAISGVPFPAFLIFAVVGLLAAAGDIKAMRSGALTGVAQLKRHLWRMCVAMFIATASFFSIRSRVARVLPALFVTPGMRVLPVVLVLVSMLYWLWRLRSSGRPHRIVDARAPT